MSEVDDVEPEMDVVEFAEKWIAENMHNRGSLDLAKEVADYKAQMLVAGKAKGFTESDFVEGLGDLDDYMSLAYERICGRTQKTHDM